MFTEKFNEVLNHEGVVSMVTWANDNANVTNTWNSFLVIKDDQILIPAAGLKSTESDIALNNRIKLTLGSKDVIGNNDYQGTGFLIEGEARFEKTGELFDLMYAKFPFISRVLVVNVENLKQLL